ncbi:hypothetical protein JOC77_000514 [Peribacillus deserti]|uniref:Uncharacterized protein n=1 Tax=Peribacillus deserti TaxID=673318 RepID=A0ABS2QE73_9BACI|nr:hypothetical protein [Peribacillus deserti]MBM7691109.1 hypothetical protein [Peribacillus deserti]
MTEGVSPELDNTSFSRRSLAPAAKINSLSTILVSQYQLKATIL